MTLQKKLHFGAMTEAKKIDYATGIYGGYYALASMHYEGRQMDLMNAYLDSMKAVMNDQIEDISKAEGYNLIGIAHYDNNELIDALSLLAKGQRIIS